MMSDVTSAAVSPASPSDPTSESERLVSVDVLRGFALLGILPGAPPEPHESVGSGNRWAVGGHRQTIRSRMRAETKSSVETTMAIANICTDAAR